MIHTLLLIFSLHVWALPLPQSVLSPSLLSPPQISPLWNETTWFYRSPSSAFPSGQLSRRELEKTQKKTDLDVAYKIRWGNKTYQAHSDQLLRELQTASLALTKSETELMDSPSDHAVRIATLKDKSQVTIIKSLNHWCLVSDSQKTGWIPTHHLKSIREDQGVFITLMDTYLRASPTQGSLILSMASKDSRWTAVKIHSDWLEVTWENQRAFLDLAHLGHRSDFAQWAYHKSRGWIAIGSRSGGVVYSKKNQPYQLKDFIAFETDSKKALIKDPIPNGPQLRSRVTIEDFSATKWTLSTVRGHGEVWWKKDILQDAVAAAEPSFTLQEMLKKDIHSLSLDEKNSSLGLISSHGVYRTINGKQWQKIKDFGDQDLPVCIHPEGIWFAGSFRSYDQGQSFEPFLKWDLITDLIQGDIKKPPLYLKLIKIAALKNSQLEITIDSGYKKVKLRGHVLGQFWTVVR